VDEGVDGGDLHRLRQQGAGAGRARGAVEVAWKPLMSGMSTSESRRSQRRSFSTAIACRPQPTSVGW
jgi:hypothetical protein